MKASSIDLREKIVAAHLNGHHSIRTVARIFTVSKSFVQKLVKQQKLEGNLQPKKPGKPRLSYLTNAELEPTFRTSTFTTNTSHEDSTV